MSISYPGLYFFAIHMVGYNQPTRVEIKIDGQYGCEAYSPFISGNAYAGTSTCSIIRELKANQRVHAEVTGEIYYYSGFSKENLFQGFLIR